MTIETYVRRTFGIARPPEAPLGKRAPAPPRLDAVEQTQVEEFVRLFSYAIGLPDVPLGAPSMAGDPRAVRYETLRATREWISALARQGPVVARVENLHWAPQTTRLLLTHLLETPQLPLLVVATTTTEGLGGQQFWHTLPGVSFIPLRALSSEQTLQVARTMLRPLSPSNERLIAHIAKRCGGNPRFMEEMVRALIDTGVIIEDSPRQWTLASGELPTPLPIPDTIGQLVQARVDRLHPSSKLALQWAAIAGSHFWLGQLCAIGLATKNHQLDEPEEIEMALLEPLEAQLIVEADTTAPDGDKMYRFRPSLTQSLIYEGIVHRTRKQWHRQLAEWCLAQTGFEDLDALELDEIASHLVRAEEFGRAGQLYCRAGDLARSMHATGDAKVSYELSRDAYARAGETASRDVLSQRLAILAREASTV
jgi:predicted ATPase